MMATEGAIQHKQYVLLYSYCHHDVITTYVTTGQSQQLRYCYQMTTMLL